MMRYLFEFKKPGRIIFWVAITLVLSGCTTSISRQHVADKRAELAGFSSSLITAGKFTLQTYQKISNPQLPYVIYLEGDGFAFKNKREISPNPTPKDTLVLDLAAQDYRPNVIYIARPCQYHGINDHACNSEYWTRKRMAPEVIDSINIAIKQMTHGNKIELIGYSGGGGIAVLVAAKNSQIKSIKTIAANLDHVRFNQYHNVLPMVGSLNPIDFTDQVKHIPQIHYSGGLDKVILPFIADNFIMKANSTCIKHEIMPKATHNKGWDKVLNDIITSTPTCTK